MNIPIILKLRNTVQKYSQRKKPIFHFMNIYGLGLFRVRFLLIFFGLNYKYNFLFKFLILKKNYLLRLQQLLDKKSWLLETILKNRRNLGYILEKKIKIYSFYRKKFNLPSRGQRTHSNRQTMKNFFKFNNLLSKDTFTFNNKPILKKLKGSKLIKRKIIKKKNNKKKI